jgi:WD40 repeat protein
MVHEALIQRWGQLREWMAEDRVFRTWQERLRAGLQSWQASGSDEGALLRGGPLAEAEDWLAEKAEQMSAAEREYIESSVALRERREMEREARRQRELETAQKLAETESIRAEEQTRAAGRLRRSARYLAGALVVAAVLAVIAFLANQQASRNAETAEANFQLAATREVEAVSEAKDRATAQAFAEAQQVLAVDEAAQRATAQAEAELERIRADDERDNALAAEATAEALAEAEAAQRTIAEEQRAAAEEQREEARRQASIGLGAQALLELESDFPERAPLLAIEALENYPYTWQAERALGQAMYASHLRLLLQHDKWVNTVTWSPDGTQIATASDDGSAKVWDAATGELLFYQQGHDPFTVYADWSPSGDRILTTGWDDRTAKIWDAATGEEMLTLAGHEGRVRTCGRGPLCTSGYSAWSPSGDRVVTYGEDGYVIVWDAATGEVSHHLAAHQDIIRSVAWSSAGDLLLSSSYDGTAKVWDLRTGQEFRVIADQGSLAGALWSPSGNRFVTLSWNNAAKVWDVVTGEELVVLDERNQLLVTAAWSAGGESLVTISEQGEVILWDALTGEALQRFGNIGPAFQLEWAPSGHQFATSGLSGTARVWSLSSPMKRLEIPERSTYAVSWSPDGRQVARAYEDGQIKLFDGQTGQIERVIRSDHQGSFGMSWSPSGRQLLTVGLDGAARIWDTQSGEPMLSLAGHEGRISEEAAWSPDGDRVATSGMDDGTVRVWDSTSGAQLELLSFTEYDDQVLQGPWWSPDGQKVVSVVNKGGGGATSNAKVWDPVSGEVLLDLYPPGLLVEVGCVAWSPDSSRLLIGTGDNKFRVWDAVTGEETLIFDSYPFAGCGWFPDGDRILTGGARARVRVWDATTGAELLALQMDGQHSDVRLAPDGRRFLINWFNGPLQVFDIWQSTEELLRVARQCCVLRELTPEERELFGLPER